jgi:hypothetical protein
MVSSPSIRRVCTFCCLVLQCCANHSRNSDTSEDSYGLGASQSQGEIQSLYVQDDEIVAQRMNTERRPKDELEIEKTMIIDLLSRSKGRRRRAQSEATVITLYLCRVTQVLKYVKNCISSSRASTTSKVIEPTWIGPGDHPSTVGTRREVWDLTGQHRPRYNLPV